MTDKPTYGVKANGRHAATQQVARWFSFGHLHDGPPRDAAQSCAALAQGAIDTLPDGPELTAGLRKLLEAKDCFVRAAIAGEE